MCLNPYDTKAYVCYCSVVFILIFIFIGQEKLPQNMQTLGRGVEGGGSVDYIIFCYLLKMATKIEIKGIRHDIWRHCHVEPPIMILLMRGDLFWVVNIISTRETLSDSKSWQKNYLSLTCRIIKQVLCLIYCCHSHFSFF